MPAQDGAPDTLPHARSATVCPAATGSVLPERSPPAAGPVDAALEPVRALLEIDVLPSFVQPERPLSNPGFVSAPHEDGGADAVVTFSAPLWADQFPAASRARTVIACEVPAVRPVTANVVAVGVPTDVPLRKT